MRRRFSVYLPFVSVPERRIISSLRTRLDVCVLRAGRDTGDIRQGHFATVVVAEGVGIAADGAVESVVGIGEAFYQRLMGRLRAS